FEAVHSVPHNETLAHDEDEDGAAENQQLHEAREWIGDEGAVEGDGAARPAQQHHDPCDDEERDRQDRDKPLRTLPQEDAKHHQRHAAQRHDEFGTKHADACLKRAHRRASRTRLSRSAAATPWWCNSTRWATETRVTSKIG